MLTSDISEYQAIELAGLIEDMVSIFCNENIVSGETAWAAVAGLAIAHLGEFDK